VHIGLPLLLLLLLLQLPCVLHEQASRFTAGRQSAQVGLKEAEVLGDTLLLKEARDCNISEAAQRSAKAVQLTGSAVVSHL
jgi:hypothetical protein